MDSSYANSLEAALQFVAQSVQEPLAYNFDHSGGQLSTAVFSTDQYATTSEPQHNGNSSHGHIGPVKRPLEQPFQGAPAPKRFEAQERDVVFRLLLPADKVSHLIGRFGTYIRDISQSTAAKIKVVEAVPSCTERVVIIYAKDTPGVETCPSQTALFALHKRLHSTEQVSTEGAEDGSGDVDAHMVQPDPLSALMTRMLVAYTQCGSVIGKSGSIIKDIKTQTGANIKILPVEELPSCALANDRVCQFAGTFEQMEHAMRLVTLQLRKNPPKDMPGGPIALEPRGTPAGYPSVTAARLTPTSMFGPRGPGMTGSTRPQQPSAIMQPPVYY